MAWASIVNSECVTALELQNAVDTAVFTAKGTTLHDYLLVVAGDNLITKADADNYVNIDTSFGSYASLTSNEEVIKSNLQAPVATYTINWNFTKVAGTTSGSMKIYKNSTGGTPVVSTSITDSGSLTVNITDTLYVLVFCSKRVGFTSNAYLQVINNGTNVKDDTVSLTDSAVSNEYGAGVTYTLAGNNTITGSADNSNF